MNAIRQSVFALSFLMGIWVLASFVGVMFNPSNAELWTNSLVWALLASVFVMPGLVVAYHMAPRSVPTRQQTQGPTPLLRQQPPFVDEDEQEGALWPERDEEAPEESSRWS
jgi:hypothetical protein